LEPYFNVEVGRDKLREKTTENGILEILVYERRRDVKEPKEEIKKLPVFNEKSDKSYAEPQESHIR
jgi:hypothetical protein